MNREDLLRANAEYGVQTSGLQEEYTPEVTPNLTTSKLQTLETLKQDKINRLAGTRSQPRESIPTTGLYDADTLYIANPYTSSAQANQGQKVTGARLQGVNAPELKVNGQLTQDGINARIQADSYIMGVDAPNFPEGEGLDPQYYDIYVQHMNPALEQRANEGKFRAVPTGYQGYYGRDLFTGHSEEMPQDMASYLIEKGQAVPKDYSGIQQVVSPRYEGTRSEEAPTFESGGKTYKFTDTGIEEVKAGDDDGRIGETVDMAQASLAKVGSDMVNMLKNVVGEERAKKIGDILDSIDKFTGGDGKAGWFIRNDGTFVSDDTKNIYDYRELEHAQREFGVKDETIVAHNEAMSKGLEQWKTADSVSDYIGAMAIAASQLDRILATSAGEMLGLAVPYVGVPALAATRTSNYAEEYEKNNNKKMSAGKLAETFIGQLGVLTGERFLIRTGLPQRFGGIVGVGPVQRGLAIAGSAAGEAMQEYGEAITEVWATQTEGERTLADIAVDPESTFGAAVGGLMGGALRGGKETLDVTGTTAMDVVRGRYNRQDEKEAEAPTRETDAAGETTRPTDAVDAEALQSAVLEAMKKVQRGDEVTVDDYNAAAAFVNMYQDNTDARTARAVRQAQALKKHVLKKLEQSAPEDVQSFVLGSKQPPTDMILDTLELNETSRNNIIEKLRQAEVISEQLSKGLKKSFETVEQDATEGLRGYKTYEVILNELNKEPEVNAAEIAKYQDKVAGFLASQERYLDKLNTAKRVVEKEINSTLSNEGYTPGNNVKVAKWDGEVPGVVKYRVPDLKQADGKPFVLTMNRTVRDGKNVYVADAADKIANQKRANIEALQRILDSSAEVEIETTPAMVEDTEVEAPSLNIDAEIEKRGGDIEPARATLVENVNGRNIDKAIKQETTGETTVNTQNEYLSDSAIRTEARATEFALEALGKSVMEERPSDVLPWDSNEEYLTKVIDSNAKTKPTAEQEPDVRPTEQASGASEDVGSATQEPRATAKGDNAIVRAVKRYNTELGGALKAVESKIMDAIEALDRADAQKEVARKIARTEVAKLKNKQEQNTKASADVEKALKAVQERLSNDTENKYLQDAEIELTNELQKTKEFEKSEVESGKTATEVVLAQGAKKKNQKEASLAQRALKSTVKGAKALLAISDDTMAKLEPYIAAVKQKVRAVLAKSQGYNELWIADSPARMLMDRLGTTYPDKIAEAMGVVMVDFQAQAMGDLLTNTNEDVAKILGRPSVPRAAANMLKNIGKSETLLATQLGAKILKLVGIDTTKDMPASLKPRLEADLGGTLLRIMVANGVLEELQVISADTLTQINTAIDAKELGIYKLPKNPNNPMTTYRLSRKLGKKKIADMQSTARELMKQLDTEMKADSVRSGARTAKTNGKRKFSTKNAEEVSPVSEYVNETLNSAENTPFVAHEAAKQLASTWGENRDYTKLTKNQKDVMNLFGYVDTNPETTEVHIDKRDDVEADNRTIFRKLSYFADHIEQYGDVDSYFNYFVGKNGRLYLDSATVNPQTDKIARFVLVVKTNDGSITKDNVDVFKLGVVQAFDGSPLVVWKETADEAITDLDGVEMASLGAIDKQSTEESLKQFEQILNNDVVATTVEAIRNGTVTVNMLIAATEGTDHPSHAMAALYELAKYKPEGGFKTNLVIETDGVTSGVFLGHLLNPVMSNYEKLKAALTRGGMFFGGDIGKTYGAWKGEGGTDTYQAGIVPIQDILKTDAVYKGFKGIQQLVPIDRNFMKNPLMVFFYGAGQASIQRAIARGVADDVVATLSKNQATEADVKAYRSKVKAVLNDAVVDYKNRLKEDGLSESKAKMYTRMLTNLSTAIIALDTATNKELRDMTTTHAGVMKTVYDVVFEQAQNVLGEATVRYLQEEYGDVRRAQEAMNMVFKGSFGVFKKHYNEKLVKRIRGKDFIDSTAKIGAKIAKDKLPVKDSTILEHIRSGKIQMTKADIDAVLQELVEEGLVPGILTVDSKKDTEKAAIIKKERQTIVEDTSDGKNTKHKTVQIHTTQGQKVLNPLIYEYVANPVAGGVINVHYFDSAMIQRIVRQSIGLGVHDAFVTNVTNAIKAGKDYNTAVWEESQKFDMLAMVKEEFLSVTKDSGNLKAFTEELFDKDHMDKRKDAFAKETGLPDMLYKKWAMEKLKDTLTVGVNNSSINKKRLANEEFTLAQMAGPEGIEYTHAAGDAAVEGIYMEWAEDVELLSRIEGITKEEKAIIQSVTDQAQVPKEYITTADKRLGSKLTVEQQQEAAKYVNCT